MERLICKESEVQYYVGYNLWRSYWLRIEPDIYNKTTKSSTSLSSKIYIADFI